MKQKELLVFSIVVFLTVIAWMIIDIYHVRNSILINKEFTPIPVRSYTIDNSIPNILKGKVK